MCAISNSALERRLKRIIFRGPALQTVIQLCAEHTAVKVIDRAIRIIAGGIGPFDIEEIRYLSGPILE